MYESSIDVCFLLKVEQPAKFRRFRLVERKSEVWCARVLLCSFIYYTYFYLLHHTAVHV